MKFSFNKKDKLKSKKLIDALFSQGKSVSSFPLRLVYLSTEFEDNVMFKTGVSVSKKHFKKAVDRNRIKRLIREAFRLHKTEYFNNISTPHAFMILYIGSEKPSLTLVENKMKRLFEKFENNIASQ